ncbi:MAG: S-methyl-5-thioribose-1-phosphate isomerase [Phototrophicaceae bacterium]
MKVNGQHYRTIWLEDAETVQIIDQRYLPHEFVIESIQTVDEMAAAIQEMHLRGAGLIGAAAGFGMYLAVLNYADSADFVDVMSIVAEQLKRTRPTAVNLEWAVMRQLRAVTNCEHPDERITVALATAQAIADEDAAACQQIGVHGLQLIEQMSATKSGETVHILTHCNAGWLAFVDYGSATAPIYAAHDLGIDVHVWVDETRPRNQGARLTAWELGQHGVPHTVIADNVGGHLMQHGQVDMVITGTDRVTRTGDVANKIGTYLKALAAKDNHVPFYVALPSSTFDWDKRDGLREIPIEERGSDEVKMIQGLDINDNVIRRVLLTPPDSPAINYGFDVTPSRLVTGLITERGIASADETSILALFPEHA